MNATSTPEALAGIEARCEAEEAGLDSCLIRGFLWTAITDPAAEARLGDLRSRLKGGRPANPSVIGQALRQIVEDAWRAGSEADWNVITGQLIAAARAVNGEA